MSGSCIFRETGSASFPTSAFSWRDLVVAGLPGWRGAAAASVPDSTRDDRNFAGGFRYRDSALVSSTLCRNRFIFWQCCGSSLYLLELSLDTSLAHAALRVDVKDGSVLVPEVNIQEVEGRNVVVLFATTSAVFRLLLLHPEAISKDPTLSSASGGLQPSVFATAQPDSLQGSNMAALFSQHSSAQPISMVTGWITQEGLTTFALASPSGSIHLIQLPSPQAHGLPVRSELKQSSVMHRLWASFIPAAIRGGGDAEDAPVNLAIHSFGRNIIVLALCRDLHLRLWSTEPPECIMSCDLEEYVLQELEHNFSATKLLLRKATGGTLSSLRFAVYIETSSGSQMSLFQLLAVDRQLHLDHIHSCPCKNDAELVDFQATNSEVWGVWKGEDGETVLQHATYDGENCHVWQRAHVSPPPPRDISVTPTSEPRSVFLDALLYPGRFSTSAINKALELYGFNPAKESVQELRKEATVRVEQELLSSAGSTELLHEEFRELQLKCWTKFYGCCYQYYQLMSQPLGVFQDPSTGLVCLFKEGMLSFVHPAIRADCLVLESHLSSDNLPSDDIARFMEIVQITKNQLSTEAMDSLLSSAEPITMANELAVAIVDQPAEDSVLSVVKERLSEICSLSDVLRGIAELMDPTSHLDSLNSSGEELPDTDIQLALSQLFSSPLCEKILVASLRETCLTQMALARDILVVLCLLQHNKFQAVDHTHMAQFTSLLQNYRCLHWLSCKPTLPASPSSLENNLRQLAALNISTSSRGPLSTTEGSVLELYLRGVGGSQLRSALLRSGWLSSEVHLCSLWTSLLPESIGTLIAQLWPCTNSVAVCQFLLSTCQYTHLQDYVTQVAPLVHEGQYSLHFLVGQSYLTTGELDKAEDHFVRATGGLGDSSETLLQCVVRGKGESGEGGTEAEEEEEGEERVEEEEEVEEEKGEGEGSGRRRLRYYLRVMRLFEQVPSPLAVVNVAEMAIRDMDGEDPLCVVVWSALFKYHLELGHYESAYKAMMANPDPIRRKECLRHFVVILTELQQLKLLCHLTYPGMEEEIERVIEDRARSVDVVKHKYYDLLYCFHTTRQNYRKAASVMYEYGLRLGREAPGPKSLQKQANCFCMCLTALHLAEPQYAWVVVPVELEEILAQNTKKSLSRKRAHPSHQAPQQQVEVRTIPDIEKEYVLAKTKLSLLRREPSMASQICSPFVSPEEVIARLVQVGLFDKAVDTALQFDLSLDSVFEALASRCVHLSMNVVTFREGVGDVSSWNWLGMNESMDAPTPTEKTVADKAWLMLKSYLETYDTSYRLQKCVARKLLSLGSNLPQWMVKRYKETNPAELLRLYLTFDLLEEATYLALDYIDAVLGPQKLDFAMKTTLHASSPSVWLPYSALDHLQSALQGAQRETLLAELSSQLSSKLEDYFRTISSVTSDKEHHVQQRMMATH